MNFLRQPLAFVCVASLLAGCGGSSDSTQQTQLLANKTVVVEPIADEMRLSSGFRHTVVLAEDGTVQAWGGNELGQLGNGDDAYRDSNTPVTVLGLSQIKAVRTSGWHSAALNSNGSVWAWGDNRAGQLGNTNSPRSNRPVRVLGLSDIKTIATGEEHTIALDKNGSVWGWGRNGAPGASRTVQRVPALQDVAAIAAGGYHSVALKNDLSVWTWGANYSGMLGNSSLPYTAVPTIVHGLSYVKAVAAGRMHTLALKLNGTVWAWGNNTYGELGISLSEFYRVPYTATPTMVYGLSGVVAVAAGEFNSAAVLNNGTVWVWGNNFWGQLGQGNQESSYVPVKVNGIDDAVAVSVGSGFITVLKADGNVVAAGYNGNGQLGIGEHYFGQQSLVFQKVRGELGRGFLKLGKSAKSK